MTDQGIEVNRVSFVVRRVLRAVRRTEYATRARCSRLFEGLSRRQTPMRSPVSCNAFPSVCYERQAVVLPSALRRLRDGDSRVDTASQKVHAVFLSRSAGPGKWISAHPKSGGSGQQPLSSANAVSLANVV